MLESFGYGKEFLRLNYDALEAYSSCQSSDEVLGCQAAFERSAGEKKAAKEDRIARERENIGDNIGGYMDDMDLPPIDSGSDSGDEEEDQPEVYEFSQPFI
jgi:hypothetical protein